MTEKTNEYKLNEYAKSAKRKTVGLVLSIIFDFSLIAFCCFFAYLNASHLITGPTGNETSYSMIFYLIIYTIQILATILWIKSLVRDIKEIRAFDPIEYAAKLEQEDKDNKEAFERSIQQAILRDKIERELKERENEVYN